MKPMPFLPFAPVAIVVGGLMLMGRADAKKQARRRKAIARRGRQQVRREAERVRQAARQGFEARVEVLDETLAEADLAPEARAALEDARDEWAARIDRLAGR